jgi:chemotaxis response regulator CheB
MTTAARQILIVEDVDIMRQLLSDMISGIAGLEVSGVAQNGWEARLELTRRRPDLVLLDEILPGESAADLLAEFHATGIPVLLLTSLEKPTHELPHGAAGRIIKPSFDTLDADRVRFGNAIFSQLS